MKEQIVNMSKKNHNTKNQKLLKVKNTVIEMMNILMGLSIDQTSPRQKLLSLKICPQKLYQIKFKQKKIILKNNRTDYSKTGAISKIVTYEYV